MQNVELFVNNLRNIYDKDDSSQETQKLIVEMQSFLNLSTFKDMKHEYRSRIFKEFWSFLFYSTRYSGNSTIRLSIIRTTALFIFQLISFYPTRIETAFADVLAEYAIDTLTATVAVPSYAILSYHQSPVTQDSFVSRCPVFHHICRKEALDYFPNTLSHFDHLKPEWHQSVLTNLLSKTFLKRQFNYWKLVVQIVSNNVNALFKVVFMAMFKQKDWGEILPMFAQLFFMNDAPHDSVNLYPIACFSLELIASETKQPISRITAALEILSLRTSSFQTKITMKVKGRTQIKEKVIENHEIIKNDQETKGNTDNLKNEQNNNEYNSIGENLNDLNVKNEVASIDKESLENGENNLKSILNHEKSHDEFDVGDDDVISITVSNKVNTITKDFNAKTFLTIPAFYDIGPPVEYLFPSEDDGFTILSVKLRNLIPHINNPKYTNKIINIVKAIINKPYDSYQSTCFQAIAQALPNINGQKERKLLFNELEKLFYSKSASWFHDLEILNIMKCYSGEFIIQTYGDSPRTANFFNQLIKFSKMSNDTLSQAAQDSMKLLSSSEQFVKTVMHQCDLFNPIDFQRTLQILSNNSCQNMTSQFIPLVFEAFDFYSYDKNVFTSICKFLSNFSLEKLPPSILNSCLLVLSATYTVITGISWIVTNNTNLESYEKVYQIIKESISTQPLDIITHKIFDYTNVLTLTVEVLNLIKSIEQIDASIIFDIIDHLFLLFPSLCTNIFWAHRGKLTTDQIITILNRFYIRIFYVPGSDVAKIWCQQIIIIIYNDPTKSDALRKTIDAMTKYTNKILSDVINGLNSNFNNIPNSTLHVFSKFNQLLSQEKIIIPETVGSKKNTPRIKKILHQKIKNAAKRKSVFPKIFKKDQLTLKFNLNDPIIETQLRYNTYKFSNDEISQLLSLFMKKSSKSGLHALCRYAKSNNLILPELNKSQNSLTLHHLKSMEKIKFKDLVHFSENQNNENSSEFLDFIFTQIYKDLKPKTISLYLIFLANILNRANKVKMKTASNIIEILNKNKNNFNIDLIMMVVALLSQKLPKKKRPKDFIIGCKPLIPSNSPGFFYFLISVLKCCDIQTENFYNNVLQMLNSSIPSIFISAVRLSSLLTGHSETLNNFLSNNWKKLFDVNQKFPNNDVIQYNVSILIFNIFKSHKLSNSQNFILANHNLILNQTQRGFFYFAKIYPLLFNIATQKSVVFETKFLPPLNRFLPFPYIESFFGMINEVATYQHQIHKDPNIIKEICKEFLKLTQCINVVYLHEYVYRFELFLSNFYENEEIVKKLILIRPFFHLFVGTIRFVMVQEEKNSQINNQMNEKKINEKNFENNNEQSHENDNEENEEKSDERSTETKKENIRKSLTFLMKLKCRAHSMAFGIALNDPKNMKKALELAAFDSDCSESEKILATYSYKTV